MHSDQPRVLVIDDERHLREMLELGLRQNGFDVRLAADGIIGLNELKTYQADVIVLDVMLPKIDGVALVPHVRRLTQAPIVMLSAKSGVPDRVVGLEGGADDYLGKPFELQELVARLRSALRRPNLAEQSTYTFADLSVDTVERRVRRGEESIDLSTREFDLLTAFIRAPKRVFTRDQLLDAVWGQERDVLPGTVETYVSYLRAKIDKPPARRLIHTIRGVGYALRDE
jgi:DNA-binding response OmpR family regulator